MEPSRYRWAPTALTCLDYNRLPLLINSLSGFDHLSVSKLVLPWYEGNLFLWNSIRYEKEFHFLLRSLVLSLFAWDGVAGWHASCASPWSQSSRPLKPRTSQFLLIIKLPGLRHCVITGQCRLRRELEVRSESISIPNISENVQLTLESSNEQKIEELWGPGWGNCRLS